VTQDGAAPSIQVRSATAPVRAVALILPGGKAESLDPTSGGQLTALRMRPFAAALHRQGATQGVEVRSLRYRVRGWNGPQMSPIADAQWALRNIRLTHGGVPIALVGHSMGGRVAMRVAGDDDVVSVVGLAPWLPGDEPVVQLRHRKVLIAHGTLDVVTSARASRRYADRAAAAGAQVTYLPVAGEMHAMLFQWRRWHRLTTRFTLDALRTAG
jgi:alpha-beta hydrolase superfamily lysophospholipase